MQGKQLAIKCNESSKQEQLAKKIRRKVDSYHIIINRTYI